MIGNPKKIDAMNGLRFLLKGACRTRNSKETRQELLSKLVNVQRLLRLIFG
jgi:hypothetical protein